MLGAIVLVAILLVFPFVVTSSMSALAALLGFFLHRDNEHRHEGSELLDTNY